MERIVIGSATSKSEILIGTDWKSVSEMIPAGRTVILTDDNIFRLYGDCFPDAEVFVLPAGEETKSLSAVKDVSEKLLASGVDRSGFILGIGGGVVCDIAGFVASIYMRGLGCGFVSSSLLSQVDASTGGKNGVNLGGAKNMLGTIRQPEFVICDPAMLLTLPDEEYLSGLAELIKTAIIGDRELFDLIEANSLSILRRDTELLARLVARSVRFKAEVVSQDERETGLRRILNFGHTFGHAIEMAMSFRHGFAVASGMELAAGLSLSKGFISSAERERITGLLYSFGLLNDYDITEEKMKDLIIHDKKKSGGDISFVFTHGIGKSDYSSVPVSELLDFYRSFRINKDYL